MENVVIVQPSYDEYVHMTEFLYREEKVCRSKENYALYQQCDQGEDHFIAKDITSGEPLGIIVAMRHGANLGYLGSYYVKSRYRGQGVGKLLWKRALEHLDGRNIALWAATNANMWEKYRDHHGFSIIPEWRALVSQGVPVKHMNHVDLPDTKIVDINQDLLKDVIAYDKSIQGDGRADMLRSFCEDGKGHTQVAMDCTGAVTGYAMLRPTAGPWRLGPLYADSGNISQALTHKIIEAEPEIYTKGLMALGIVGNEDHDKIIDALGVPALRQCYALFTQYEVEVPRKVVVLSQYDLIRAF